jgi:predicted ABC-type transport system involved in lysophospholipase L1 biosynthesis ATPase subunit
LLAPSRLHVLGGMEHPSGGEFYLTGRRIDRMSETDLAKLRRHASGIRFNPSIIIDDLMAVENVEPAGCRSASWMNITLGITSVCSLGL